WCRPHGRCGTAVRGVRARSSGGASAPGRTASRTAPAPVAAPPPRLLSAHRSQRLELGAQRRELVALGRDDGRWRLGDEAGVGELRLGPGDLRFKLSAALLPTAVGGAEVDRLG